MTCMNIFWCNEINQLIKSDHMIHIQLFFSSLFSNLPFPQAYYNGVFYWPILSFFSNNWVKLLASMHEDLQWGIGSTYIWWAEIKSDTSYYYYMVHLYLNVFNLTINHLFNILLYVLLLETVEFACIVWYVWQRRKTCLEFQYNVKK